MGNLDKKRTYLESLKRSLREGSATPTLPAGGPAVQNLEREGAAPIQGGRLCHDGHLRLHGNLSEVDGQGLLPLDGQIPQTRYPHVETVFLAHHTEAMQVTEEQFFHRVESGGTRCSSVYELALQLIETRYPAQRYNLYAYHFTDGDNLTSDNEPTVELARRLIESCNRVGYGEINPNARSNTLMQHMRSIKHPAFVTATFRSKEDIHPSLKRFFSRADGEGGSRHATH